MPRLRTAFRIRKHPNMRHILDDNLPRGHRPTTTNPCFAASWTPMSLGFLAKMVSLLYTAKGPLSTKPTISFERSFER